MLLLIVIILAAILLVMVGAGSLIFLLPFTIIIVMFMIFDPGFAIFVAVGTGLFVAGAIFISMSGKKPATATGEPMWIVDKPCVQCGKMLQRVARKCSSCGAANPIDPNLK